MGSKNVQFEVRMVSELQFEVYIEVGSCCFRVCSIEPIGKLTGLFIFPFSKFQILELEEMTRDTRPGGRVRSTEVINFLTAAKNGSYCLATGVQLTISPRSCFLK